MNDSYTEQLPIRIVIKMPIFTVLSIISLNFLTLLFSFHRATLLLIALFISLFLGVLVYPKDKKWGSIYKFEFEKLIRNKWDIFLFIFPFLLLIIWPNYSPKILFLDFDLHAKIISAWFLFSVIWLNKYYRSENVLLNYRQGVFFVFLLTSCAVWMLLIWSVGAGKMAVLHEKTNRL